MPHRLTLALTGASGMPYALGLLKALVARRQAVTLLLSDAAREVLRLEHDIILPADPAAAEACFRELSGDRDGLIRLYANNDWSCAAASGSGAPRRMVICPCSMGTLAAIAQGLSDNLIERAADVALKERRRLIVVPREMPYSEIHLEQMLRLTRMGALLLPASPGFYHRPQRIEDLIDFVVARILTHLGIEQRLLPSWGYASAVQPVENEKVSSHSGS